jgi:predicted transcriptional regulator
VPHRSAIIIILSLLDLCQTPKRITSLVNSMGMNHKALIPYIDFCKDRQLLAQAGGLFYTTLRGAKLLEDMAAWGDVLAGPHDP